jgi:putative hydrolase of the HAD superfamily
MGRFPSGSAPRESTALSPAHLPHLTGLLLDAGNTLLELDHGLMARHFAPGGDLPEEAVRLAEQTVRRQLDAFVRRSSTESPDTLRYYLDLVGQQLNLPRNDRNRGVEGLCAFHREANLWQRAAPGSHETLRTLRKRGLRIGVVSNSRGDVAGLLSRLGLGELLDTVIDSGILGVEKPDPAIFRAGLAGLGVEASRCAYVGDLPSVDVRGARRADLEPILIDPAGVFADVACIKIQQLMDLCTLLNTGPNQTPSPPGSP